MPDKRCSGCKQTKPASEFYKNRRSNDGLQVQCKDCHRGYYRKKGRAYFRPFHKAYKQRNRDFIERYKSERGCARCPEKHPACLEFHHTDPSTKRFTISTALANPHALATLKAEMDKCEVICSNCHRKEHDARRKHLAVVA